MLDRSVGTSRSTCATGARPATAETPHPPDLHMATAAANRTRKVHDETHGLQTPEHQLSIGRPSRSGLERSSPASDAIMILHASSCTLGPSFANRRT
eukprot:44925-Eustigmatos_ZCMA.PRE.1